MLIGPRIMTKPVMGECVLFVTGRIDYGNMDLRCFSTGNCRSPTT